MKKLLLSLVALLLGANVALADSTINPTQPAQNSDLVSSVVRNNFAAAYNDVRKILGKYAGNTAPSAPVNLQDWVDTTGTPNYVFKIRNVNTGAWVSWATLNISTGVFSVTPTAGGFAATPPLAVTFPAGVATYAINLDSNFAVNGSSQLSLTSTGSGRLIANCTGGSAEPVSCTWTSFADQAIGTTNGMIPYRVGGTWSTIQTGTSGAAIPRLDTANTWGALQTFPSPSFTGTANGASMTLSGALTVTGSFTATGLVDNASLANPSTTVNGTVCTLGSSCTVTAVAGTVTVGTTLVASGVSTRVLMDNAGTLGEYSISGSGNVAMTTSPAFTTPSLGVATGTSLALGGCTIGTNDLCTNGTTNFGGGVTLNGATSTGVGTIQSTVSSNIEVSWKLTNTSTGTGALTYFSAANSANLVLFGIGGTGYTAISGLQNRAVVLAGTGTDGVVIYATGAKAIDFYVNTSRVGGFTTGGAFQIVNSVAVAGCTIGANVLCVTGASSLGGNTTITGQAIHTGTSAPSSAAGNTVVMGTLASAPTLTNTGQAFFYNTTAGGAVVSGDGSSDDFRLYNKSAGLVMNVPTGTTVPRFPGLASGTCSSGLALDASNNVVKSACAGAATSIQVAATSVTSSGDSNRILSSGTVTAGTGTLAELTLGTGLSLSGSAIVANGGNNFGAPNMKVYRATPYSVSAGVVAKVTFDTTDIDTGSYWDNTNKYYKPLVSGTYQFCAFVTPNGTTMSTDQILYFSKNGTIGSGGTSVGLIVFNQPTVTGDGAAISGCTLSAMNGSTDTMEMDYGPPGTGTSITLACGANRTCQFTAMRIGP